MEVILSAWSSVSYSSVNKFLKHIDKINATIR